MKFHPSVLIPFLAAKSVFASHDIDGLQDILKQAQDLRTSSKTSLRGVGDIQSSLADLLGSLDEHTKDLPEDLKFVVDETNDLLRMADEIPLDGEEDHPVTKNRRKLQRNKTGADAKGIAVDALGHIKSIPGMGRHLQLHDAIISGDLSFAKSKIKSLGRKLNRHRTQDFHHRRNQESTQKAEQCQELVDCASGMTVYDLLVFFYGDDIDFDNGEFDTDIQNFDSDDQAIVYSKREAIVNAIVNAKALVESANAIYADGDACDVLLEEFHRNVEEDNYVTWVGSTVIDVCRAQGSTDYVKFESIDEVLPDKVHTYIFEDLVLCARDIYDNRPSDYDAEEFVFVGEKSDTSEQYLRIPFGVNADAYDEHGRIKADATMEDIYQFTSDDGECGIAGRKCDDALDECFGELNDLYAKIFFTFDSFVALGDSDAGQNRTWPAISYSCNTNQDSCDIALQSGDLHGFDLPTCDSGVDGSAYDGFTTTSYVAAGDNYSPFEIFNLDDGAAHLDSAAELVFGEKPSVGAICIYAEEARKPADERKEDFLPGYCCMDSPFETDPWGYEFDCDAGKSACNTLAPTYFAGYSEESCAVYSGKWCPNDVDCSVLQTCVNTEVDLAQAENRTAYLNYLLSAPTIDDTATDRDMCIATREYYGFDGDLPDSIDYEICEEIERLRDTSDFSDLDEFTSRSQSNSATQEELLKPAEPGYSSSDGLSWRYKNQGYEQTSIGIEQILDVAGSAYCFDNAICETVKSVYLIAISIIHGELSKVHSTSEFNYGETVGLSDYQENEIYENVAVIYDNMATTYSLLGQVDTAVVEVQTATTETLTAVNEVNSTTTAILEILDMTQNPNAKFAGCDGWDQDQDEIADECDEDNFPPEVSIDLGGGVLSIEGVATGQLKISSDKAFASPDAAKAFLDGIVKVTDDCASADALAKTIEYIGGSCDKSEFAVFPTHRCEDTFTNGTVTEKVGTPRLFFLDVDGIAPALSTSIGERQVNVIYLDQHGGMFDTQILAQVTDDCSTSGTMEVLVKTNEIDESRTTYLTTEYTESGDELVTLYVASNECKESNSNQDNQDICITDPSGAPRYYQVEVHVEDEAGNKSVKTNMVIVVPKSNNDFKIDYNHGQAAGNVPDGEADITDETKQILLNAVERSQKLYLSDSQSVSWGRATSV